MAPKENIVTRLEVKAGKIDEPEDAVDPDKTPELVVVFARDERTSLAARAPGRHNGDLGNGPRINGTKISSDEMPAAIPSNLRIVTLPCEQTALAAVQFHLFYYFVDHITGA